MLNKKNEDAGVIDDISAKLSAKEEKQTEDTNEPKAVEPIPFDVGKLTPEQLQSLKAMLAVTPDRPTAKKKNPTIKLRVIDGRYVVAIKTAYLGAVYDPATQSEKIVHKIPIKFHDSDKFVEWVFSDFMKLDRVVCEVLAVREEKDRKVEGEVVQRETGRLVEREVIIVNYFFTIKLPDGSKIEIEGSAANA